jgi:hypothetical protein
MTLQWIVGYQALIVQQGSSVVFNGKADYAAEVDSRQYLIANDEDDNQKWYLVIQVALNPVYTGEFNSLDAAKRHGEEWELARNARHVEGYEYAELKGDADITVATLKGFGDLWADKYFVEGWAIAAAWENYKNPAAPL